MRICDGCELDLLVSDFPKNRTGNCLSCHRIAERARYRAKLAVAEAGRILRAEEAVGQLWCLSCNACGEEQTARRRATVKPLSLQAGELRCGRCGSVVFASLVSGPSTLAAAQPELARLARR